MPVRLAIGKRAPPSLRAGRPAQSAHSRYSIPNLRHRMSPTRGQTLIVNALALLGGAGIFVLILLFPWTVALAGPVLRESLFALVVLGGALGFAYGLGFRARSGLFGFLLSPWVVFATILACLLWIAHAFSVGPTHLP